MHCKFRLVGLASIALQRIAEVHSTPCVSCYLTANLSFMFAIARCVLQAAQDKSWQMNAIDVSQTMRGLANMRLGSRLLVQPLVHRAATILDTFNPQVWPTHCNPALLMLVCERKDKFVQLGITAAASVPKSSQGFFGFHLSGC